MIRALDLELLRGVGFTILLLFVFGYAYGKLYRWKPESIFLRTLFQKWQFFLSLLVVLVPLSNLCYWWAVLMDYFNDCRTATLLVVLMMAFEFIITSVECFLNIWIKGRWFSYVFSSVRGVLHLLLVYFTYRNLLHREFVQGGYFLAACWTIMIYCVLNFIYTVVFKQTQYKLPLLRVLADHLRIWGYTMVIALTISYAATWIPGGILVDYYRWYLYATLFVLTLVGVLEGFLTVFFEYYLKGIRGYKLSKLFLELIKALVYVGFALFILNAIFKVDLSSLLVGSTVISVIVGLALQETLGNFVAGLLLGVAKSYNIGDYVTVDGLTGKVEKVDWRATVIKTPSGELNIMPNSVLTKATITNYSSPGVLHSRTIDVGASYACSPNKVKEVMLQAAQSVKEVLDNPKPVVLMVDFGDSAITYRVRFWIDDFGDSPFIDSSVREAIWYYFARNNIDIPFPITTVLQPNKAEDEARIRHIRHLLSNVDFLSSLDGEILDFISADTTEIVYAPGETIFSQGEKGDSFYIVSSGKLSTEVRNDKGEVIFTRLMSCGDFFGEMALLTGEARSATIVAVEESEVLRINKPTFQKLIHNCPDLAKTFSDALAKRKRRSQKAKTEETNFGSDSKSNCNEEPDCEQNDEYAQTMAAQILSQIREFFHY